MAASLLPARAPTCLCGLKIFTMTSPGSILRFGIQTVPSRHGLWSMRPFVSGPVVLAIAALGAGVCAAEPPPPGPSPSSVFELAAARQPQGRIDELVFARL